LFEFIFEKIQENREHLILLTYCYIGNVKSSLFNFIIQSIHLHELNAPLFNHFKNSLSEGYLLSYDDEDNDDNIQFQLFESNIIENFLLFEEENRELNALHQLYPILSAEFLEIERNDANFLNFSADKINFLKQFKYIDILNESIEKIVEFDDYFLNEKLFIFIPNTIQSISSGCFSHFPTLQINLPNSVTSIGDYSFFECQFLTEIKLPKTLTSIGNQCFCCCSSLIRIIIPNSIVFIGPWTFEGCSSLTHIQFSKKLISIGSQCFSGCSALSIINLPPSIQSIGAYCFEGCHSLLRIDLPNSIRSIGYRCFSGCTSLPKNEIMKYALSLEIDLLDLF
jgi:hypothetical protein